MRPTVTHFSYGASEARSTEWGCLSTSQSSVRVPVSRACASILSARIGGRQHGLHISSATLSASGPTSCSSRHSEVVTVYRSLAAGNERFQWMDRAREDSGCMHKRIHCRLSPRRRMGIEECHLRKRADIGGEMLRGEPSQGLSTGTGPNCLNVAPQTVRISWRI